MGSTISGIFDTRREAEMAIERLVQEHGLDRAAVLVTTATAENSAGIEVAGSDAKRGPASPPDDGDDAALNGRITVSVHAEDADPDLVLGVFAEFKASDVRSGPDADTAAQTDGATPFTGPDRHEEGANQQS